MYNREMFLSIETEKEIEYNLLILFNMFYNSHKLLEKIDSIISYTPCIQLNIRLKYSVGFDL